MAAGERTSSAVHPRYIPVRGGILRAILRDIFRCAAAHLRYCGGGVAPPVASSSDMNTEEVGFLLNCSGFFKTVRNFSDFLHEFSEESRGIW